MNKRKMNNNIKSVEASRLPRDQHKSIVQLILIFLFALSTTFSFGQNTRVDSLKLDLASTSKPIERFDILNELILELTGYKGDNIDSLYCMQLLQIAQELKNDSLLAISYNWVGSYFYLNKGDNSTALEYFFKALPAAKKANDKRRISSLYFDIALVHYDLLNAEAALESTKQGAKNLPEKSHPLYYFMLIQYEASMAQYYVITKQVDSALYYANAVTKTTKKLEDQNSYRQLEATIMGAAYALQKKEKLAAKYFNTALIESNSIANTSSNLFFYTHYIPFLFSLDSIDEASNQAKDLLQIGASYDNNNLKLAAAGYLRKAFEIKNEIDSAYYYSRLEATINSEIFSQTNINRIQALAFNEQMRMAEEKAKEEAYQNQLKLYGLLVGLGVFFIIAFILYRNNRQKQKTNKVLETTLTDLKSTQSQLIQSEKMASLGELTAGIAHEIQNPLNFVNNFSDLNKELIEDLKEAVSQNDQEEVKSILKDLEENEGKITHHGKRAEEIVKSMLQHSRGGDGEKEPTDINALADEYLRLAYHGLRAKDKSFNADFKAELDPNLPKINVVPQDIGRVLLNLVNNAFQAVREVENPQVTVITRKKEDHIEICVKDNGGGIPEAIQKKIFQPFFTTKAAGQGTGLGLSMSYDIITKGHNGQLTVESKKETGTIFKIELPPT